jgi:hypothetical protein
MRKKKEIIIDTDGDVDTLELVEVKKPIKKPVEVKNVEVKKEPKPHIPDIEVARKLVNIHSSAQSRNLEFDLSFEYVKKLLEYTTCFYTNVQFTEDGPHARSFDRVDNDKGYVIGNVVACTTDINGKKNNLTIDEIIFLYKKLGHLKK